MDIRRALAAGLTHRPPAETVRDTWAWLTAGETTTERARAHRKLLVPAGLAPEREAELLAAAHARLR